MPTSDLRCALVGCGYFAENHLHAWSVLPGVDVVAVCDRQRDRAESCAHRFSIARAFTDAGAMIEAVKPDFVDIVTTPDTHRALVETVAARGVHVVCQKPMAPSLADGEAMVEACHAAGVRFMVHENFRWQRPMRAVKDACASLGPIHSARLTFRSGFDVYSRQPYLAQDTRFIIYDLGIHLLDLARFFVGEFSRLHCEISRVNTRIRGEDLATILLRGRSGAHVVVELSYGTRPVVERFPQTLIQIEGLSGTVELGPDYRIEVRDAEGYRTVSSPPPLRSWAAPPAEVIQDSVVHAQAHWLECLRRDCDAETSGEDNLRSLELVFGAYDAAANGRTYRVAGAGE